MPDVLTGQPPSRRELLLDAVVERLTHTGAAVFLGEAPGFGPDDPSEVIVVVVQPDEVVHQGQGFLVGNLYNASDTIRAIQRAYFFDFPEIDGELVAVLRGGTSVATIMQSDMVYGSAAEFETDF
jgi:hypothetical protein